MVHAHQGTMPGGGGLDPVLKQYMEQQRRQQFFAKLAQMGQGMIAASMRGADIGPAFAAGVGQASRGGGGGGNDMLQMLRLQGELDQRRERQETMRRAKGQRTAAEVLGSRELGLARHPAGGGFAPGRSLLEREEKSLTAQAYPEAVGKARVAEAFPKPAEPYTLARGAQRYGPGNELVASGLPLKPSARDAKIAALKRDYPDFNDKQINAIVDGRLKVSPPDNFGNIYLTNVATGTKTLVEGAQAAPTDQDAVADPQAQTTTGGPTLESAAAEGTGPWSNLQAMWEAFYGGLASPLGAEKVFPENVENRNYLRTIRQITKTSMVDNPKFPVAETALVAGLMPDPDQFWVNPADAVDKAMRFRSTVEEMRAGYVESMRAGGITQKERGVLADKIAATDRVLRLIGLSPQGTQGGDRGTPTVGTVEDGYRFKGGDPADQNNWEKVS